MADHRSIAAAGSSILRLLELCFSQNQPLSAARPTRVNAVRTDDLSADGSGLTAPPALTLFLYRIDFNKTLRAAWSAVGHQDGESHLPVDLHFLLTAWGDNPEEEYLILGRTLQCLENTPILSGALLDPSTNWDGSEALQVCLEDLSTEDVMRLFDSLPVDYKLSIPYVARVVVIDGGEERGATRVTQLALGSKAQATP